jgi:hypothetical protein
VIPVKKIVIIIPMLLLTFGCSTVKKTIVPDIPLDRQNALLDEYKNRTAWTRLVLEDLKHRGVVQRDTRIKIIDLDFHWNGSVTVLTDKRKKIVYGLDLDRPVTVESIKAKLDEIFWFKSPMLRQVYYIRHWGKKTARAIRNHEVYIGMTGEAALESWGVPTSLNKHEIGGKTEEQWIYKLGKHNKYIYIVDNKVTKWED